MTTALQKTGPDDAANNAMAIIERAASDPNCDTAKLRELLAVKQTWEADEARKSFARSMAIFQSRCPIISKQDSANGKAYARIDRIYREIRPILTECGFWIVWNDCEIKDGVAHISGIVGHREGHQIQTRQVIPLPENIVSREGKSVMNSAQRAGSVQTYAQRYGVCAVMGVVCGDDNDANVARNVRGPSQVQPADTTLKDLARELWEVLKPVRGEAKNWVIANQWLWKLEILDGGVPEEAPHLTAEKFKAAIAAAKEILK